MITIDKDIPIPVINSKFPFLDMEVGDSFLFPPDGVIGHRAAASLANRTYKPKKFKTRTTEEGLRCWRVA